MGSGESSASRKRKGRRNTSGLPESAGKLESLETREELPMEISKDAIEKFKGLPTKRRRALVKRYLIRGWEVEDLARLFSRHTNTIYEDVKAVRAETWKQLRADEGAQELLEEIVVTLKLESDEIVREAWQLFQTTGNDSVKLGVLKLVGERRGDVVKALQSLGLLKEAPQRLEISTADQVVEAALGHLRRAKGAKAK